MLTKNKNKHMSRGKKKLKLSYTQHMFLQIPQGKLYSGSVVVVEQYSGNCTLIT